VPTVQQTLYSSVSADYCFSCGCDEPVRAGDGRPDAVPDTADLAAAAGLPGGAGPRFGADTVERVEPSGMPARLRDRCRSARRPPDPVRDRRPALGAVAILLGRGHPRGQRTRPLLGARLLSAGLSRHGGAGVILSSALQAIGLFIATNIDDIIVLSLFFARGAGQRGTTARILAGQYLGFVGILGAAVLVSLGAGAFLPPGAIPYFGLIPLGLGLWAAWQAWRGDDDDDDDAKVEGKNVAVWTVAGVTFANGGDNIGVYV